MNRKAAVHHGDNADDDSEEEKDDNVVVSKYADSSFKQQKFKPLMTVIYSRNVLFVINLLACLFCMGGCAYMVYHHLSPEFDFMEYTHCKNNESVKCSSIINEGEYYFNNGDLQPMCSCRLDFKIKKDIPAPVGMFIQLDNFFQNERFYVASIDKGQFKGMIYNKKKNKPIAPSFKHCRSFDDTRRVGDDNRYVYPCGARAFSWFSDRFNLMRKNGNETEEIPLKVEHIAMHYDSEYVFKNPPGFIKDYDKRPDWFDEHFRKPASWRQKTYELWWNEGAYENDAFLNWMRVSAQSTPRKLFRLVGDGKCKKNIRGLCKGSYTIEIEYNFEVGSFKGTKYFGFKTVTQIGGKNSFLMYLLGGISITTFCLLPFIWCFLSPRWMIMQSSEEHTESKPQKEVSAQVYTIMAIPQHHEDIPTSKIEETVVVETVQTLEGPHYLSKSTINSQANSLI